MKLWCDTLLTYSVSSPHKLLDGALLCPACHVIHGRIADLTFPLTLLYVRTGEEKYIETANKLIEWTELNLSRPDGSWRNDAGNEWTGTCAFSAMSIGEAILRYKDRIPKKYRDRWLGIFLHISEYINTEFVVKIRPVINYYAGTACQQALAWKITGEQRYLDAAHTAEAKCRSQFDENGLLCGEMTPIDRITPKGVRPIDMGYNIEESMPLLLRYAELTGENKDFYRERYRDHMEFLLPDGAIDNSWGSRHNKWTWWGSRTSDGALSGLALVADEPMLADACERVLSLYEKYTYEGLLIVPMADIAGEPTCLHHTFCHAKALAMLAEAETAVPMRTELPCEKDYGVKFFENGNVALISHNGWRATISASDIVYAPGCENGGGSMTLLTKDGEPVCASTMHRYNSLEPLNMQYLRNSGQTPCMTPRLVFEDGTDSMTDMGAVLTAVGEYSVCASGKDWKITYTFGENVHISVKSERKAVFVLPIVKNGDTVTENNAVSVGRIAVEAENIRCDENDCGFSQVCGFIRQPVTVEVNGSAEIIISIK